MVKRELRGLRNYIGEKRVLGLAFKAREHVVKTVERGENLWLHAHNEHNTRIADEIHAFLEGPRSTLTAATCGQEQCKRPYKANHTTLARHRPFLSVQCRP